MKASVYNQKGENVGDVELNSKIFAVPLSKHLLAEAVRISQSNSRQGTSNTKTRGEVRGGGKKPWRQKGTGRARQGSTRSPQWAHGGVVFGPAPACAALVITGLSLVPVTVIITSWVAVAPWSSVTVTVDSGTSPGFVTLYV